MDAGFPGPRGGEGLKGVDVAPGVLPLAHVEGEAEGFEAECGEAAAAVDEEGGVVGVAAVAPESDDEGRERGEPSPEEDLGLGGDEGVDEAALEVGEVVVLEVREEDHSPFRDGLEGVSRRVRRDEQRLVVVVVAAEDHLQGLRDLPLVVFKFPVPVVLPKLEVAPTDVHRREGRRRRPTTTNLLDDLPRDAVDPPIEANDVPDEALVEVRPSRIVEVDVRVERRQKSAHSRRLRAPSAEFLEVVRQGTRRPQVHDALRPSQGRLAVHDHAVVSAGRRRVLLLLPTHRGCC
mmetsp:Transcript_25046/g.80941  ORF Transcript_25046/g.80941 Transcript_25046/m.80941 type:complete len:291 (+) Transcript_25046:143-1015(+)